jgi:hypothetical protein
MFSWSIGTMAKIQQRAKSTKERQNKILVDTFFLLHGSDKLEQLTQ